MVAGVGIERHDVAVGVFQADRPSVGTSPGRIVLEIRNDVAEDVIAQLGGRVVIVDHGAVDAFVLSGLLLRRQMSGHWREHPPKGQYQNCDQIHSLIRHRLSSSVSETVRRRLSSLPGSLQQSMVKVPSSIETLGRGKPAANPRGWTEALSIVPELVSWKPKAGENPVLVKPSSPYRTSTFGPPGENTLAYGAKRHSFSRNKSPEERGPDSFRSSFNFSSNSSQVSRLIGLSNCSGRVSTGIGAWSLSITPVERPAFLMCKRKDSDCTREHCVHDVAGKSP